MSQSPRLPPILTEIVVGGLWFASAVKVAGYTWESVSRTWSKLPEPGSKGTVVAPPKAVQKADKALGVPNLDRNKSFTLQTAGVAASPPAPGLAQGIINKVTGFVGGLIP